jgi:hypothetical protein
MGNDSFFSNEGGSGGDVGMVAPPSLLCLERMIHDLGCVSPIADSSRFPNTPEELQVAIGGAMMESIANRGDRPVTDWQKAH